MNEQEARQALGQIFALRFPRSWDGLDLDRYPVANYIVFRDALGPTLEASRDRLAEARARLRTRGIEPLFMMDEEGGRVTQIADFFASAPSPRSIAKTLAPAAAADLYAQMGAYLGQMGIDMDLAPCLDVVTEPMNPIIGTRSFGRDIATVSTFGEVAIRSLRRSVACVAKHFPGHGMTKLDSHLALPVVDDSRETLQNIHIRPFRDAIRWGTDGIMVSHCLYQALEAEEVPASLSRQIVHDHLRLNMGYDGLVLTDSLDMKSVTQNFSPGRAAAKAFDATCDILLYTERSERFETAFADLLDRLFMGKLNQDHLARSIRRRNHIFERSSMMQDFKPLFDSGEYSGLAETARSAAMHVADERGMLPLRGEDIVVLSTSGQAVEKMRAVVPALVEFGGRRDDVSDTRGKTLVLWLGEPLTIRLPVAALRSIVGEARETVLVTTYEGIATTLADCAVKIVTDDLSPQTEDAIIRRLLGAGK
ncbi:MAG: glycoside hydrolase family 3 N-terminal domain-containing protein [bacterium]